MKIEFESREEVQRLADALQNGIYPAPIIIRAEELLEASNGNMQLPWGSDGFHLPISIKGEEVKKAVDKPVGKLGTNRVCQKGHKKKCRRKLYTHEQVFGRNGTWEEVEKNGKKYLRRVIAAESPFQSEESLIFLAGQLDAFFQMVDAGQRTIGDIARITGQLEPFMWDLCRIWGRRQSGELKGHKYLRYRDGDYVLTSDPTL